MRSQTQERNRRLRAVMEGEGLGPSKWRQRDCITLIRAIVRELSGQEPTFDLPDKGRGLTEEEVFLRAPREYGSLHKAWVALLEGEPLLKRASRKTLGSPGMIGLTPVRGFGMEGAAIPTRGPLIGVIGPDCALWVRTHHGLSRAWPVAQLWEVR